MAGLLMCLCIGVKTGILASELLDRGLTEAQPQTIKVGRTYQRGFSATSRVPFIRLSGRWLEEAGFLEGDVLEISVALGEIRLKATKPMLPHAAG
jgi:hypothetical protein